MVLGRACRRLAEARRRSAIRVRLPPRPVRYLMPKKTKVIQYCPTGPIEKGWAGGVDMVVLQIMERISKDRFDVSAFAYHDGFFADGCRKLRAHCEIFPKKNKWHVSPIRRAAGYIREMQPDIVHVHGNYLGTFYGALAARMGKARHLVLTIHTFTTDEMQTRSLAKFIRGFTDRWIVGIADHVYTVAEFQLENPLLAAKPREQVSAVQNGILLPDLSSISGEGVREEFGIAPDEPLMISVARLHAQKGITYLLKAAQTVKERNPKVRFLLVGDGDLRDELMAEATELELGDRVIFAGWRKDVPRLLRAADCFVLPSLYEGLPIAVLESMSMGLSCVATAVCGTPELVGDTGLLVPKADPEALAEAVLKISGDMALCREQGKKARQRIEEHFTLDRMVEKVEKVYEKVLGLPGDDS
jgi:glycosyltransferase involved in cell wall biosynthesis